MQTLCYHSSCQEPWSLSVWTERPQRRVQFLPVFTNRLNHHLSIFCIWYQCTNACFVSNLYNLISPRYWDMACKCHDLVKDLQLLEKSEFDFCERSFLHKRENGISGFSLLHDEDESQNWKINPVRLMCFLLLVLMSLRQHSRFHLHSKKIEYKH